MNRRHFSGTVLLSVVGCSRSPSNLEQLKRLEAARIQRDQHRQLVESCRVANSATRTTPKPAVDPIAKFPDLKPLLRVAIRLHPRFGDEPAPDLTKLGGQFLWPSDEPFPLDPDFRLPMVPVLQLRAEDALPQVPFKPKTDLLQLFWSPRETKSGTPHIQIVWRNRSRIGTTLAEASLADVPPRLIPIPCRVLPERVAELPPIALMPQAMRSVVEAWSPPVDYHTHLAAARGTKIAGWPRVAESMRCLSCTRPMDYVLTIDSCEWATQDAARWKPLEDTESNGYRRALGIEFAKPDAAAMVFLCRNCETWPARAWVGTVN